MGRAFEYRKARKMKRWDQMAKAFTRFGREIAMAVKENGEHPETNARLRAIIQNAKAVNMPKDRIEAAIKKAASKDQSENFKEMVYEGYGPYGVAILVETATDNTTRTVANIRTCFNRSGGALGTSGSLDFIFDRKCMFRVPAKGINLEEFEFELIDVGVEEVFTEGDDIVIYGDFKAFGDIQKFLEGKGLEVLNAQFERIPTSTKELSPEQQEEINKLLEKIEDDDDVQNVYHNMA